MIILHLRLPKVVASKHIFYYFFVREIGCTQTEISIDRATRSALKYANRRTQL